MSNVDSAPAPRNSNSSLRWRDPNTGQLVYDPNMPEWLRNQFTQDVVGDGQLGEMRLRDGVPVDEQGNQLMLADDRGDIYARGERALRDGTSAQWIPGLGYAARMSDTDSTGKFEARHRRSQMIAAAMMLGGVAGGFATAGAGVAPELAASGTMPVDLGAGGNGVLSSAGATQGGTFGGSLGGGSVGTGASTGAAFGSPGFGGTGLELGAGASSMPLGSGGYGITGGATGSTAMGGGLGLGSLGGEAVGGSSLLGTAGMTSGGSSMPFSWEDAGNLIGDAWNAFGPNSPSNLGEQQRSYDREMWAEALRANRPNISNPFMSQQWSRDANGNWNLNQSLNPQDQGRLDQFRDIAANRMTAAQNIQTPDWSKINPRVAQMIGALNLPSLGGKHLSGGK